VGKIYIYIYIYIYMRAGRMGFSFIRKTASMGSSAIGALVAAGSLQLLPPQVATPTGVETDWKHR
jgi:hypothetical protein